MITLTAEEVLLAERPLSKLMGEEIPVGMAFQLSKIIKALGTELELIRKSQREIVTKYGVHDPDGKVMYQDNGLPVVPVELQENFSTDMRELLSQSCTIAAEPLSFSKLLLNDNVKLSTTDIMALEKIFVE